MSDPFASLPEKDRAPASASMLNQWINHAQKIVGTRGERTRWVLASTIAAAALQRALMADNTPLLLIKGGCSSNALSTSTLVRQRTWMPCSEAPLKTSSGLSTKR